ncbi:MAG: glycosyltransferase [Rhodospirillales bacterium]|nr:glycosyltransferase [Rhodospirillales bacterium]
MTIMDCDEPVSALTGVSFVVTVYNKAAYLPALIDGLRRQEGDFERQFIFVDDGSTDDSVAVIEREAGDLQNVIVVTQENAGPSWALNAGLARARLPYVKGLDGDDVLVPQATTLLLDALDSTGCPVAYGTHLTYWPGQDPLTEGKVIKALAAEPPPATRVDHPLDLLVRGSLFGNPSSWLARRDLLLAAGGSDPTVFIQDVSVTLRMAARAAFAVLDYPVFLSPHEDDGRLSGNKAQILHDINRAYANFFTEHSYLSAAMRYQAAKRLTGRAWKWAKRQRGASLTSPDFRRHLLCLLGLGDLVAHMDASCRSFVGEIRVPPPDRVAPKLPTP